MTTGTKTAQRYFANNGGTYDAIAILSTLGFDILWKKKILGKIPVASRYIVDQACGTGILTLKIAKRFPQSRIVGVDLHEEYVAIARRKASDLGLKNVDFQVGRAEDVVLDQPVDCITSSYLAKYADLDLLVGHAKKMLCEGGVLIMHELTYPSNPVYVDIWNLQFKFLQTYGAWRYPEWKVAFQELPIFLKETAWVENLKTSLKKYGFAKINVDSLAFQAASIVTATKSRTE
jgi:demethylmenaquinone methyltransferase/2-methoxy-6-polyprenyl-1,4-benzoquinol methylase